MIVPRCTIMLVQKLAVHNFFFNLASKMKKFANTFKIVKTWLWYIANFFTLKIRLKKEKKRNVKKGKVYFFF